MVRWDSLSQLAAGGLGMSSKRQPGGLSSPGRALQGWASGKRPLSQQSHSRNYGMLDKGSG